MLVHISKGNRKVGNVPSVSLIPVKDCGNCKLCKRDCYYLKAWRMYPGVRKACRENSTMARNHRDEYFAQVQGYLERRRPRWFRWHIAGDILDQGYLDSMKAIAQAFPGIRFLAFTKMHGLDFVGLPPNLEIVLSRWPGDAEPQACDLRQAWMQDGTETRIPDSAVECPGSCENCMFCWGLRKLGRDVYFAKH